ncbi:hypothetical protein BDF20DRAFT_825824 [Mycotypha africana]|uniref:uncharacterized protein n=1 Tax=Mycotypha africana TaxID=64632 RepID=UPI00230062D4|nr:uncharacterized protein BDF20DRAFT_825824 [Mycotypha africana]KAI8969970.1 hypothetical protein BDF20DRAFT_825824 [Mycotypha africana]
MDGLVCIITGANSLSGIGRATAFAFAKKKARAIYVTDINGDHLVPLAEEITSTTGVECIPKCMDAAADKDIQNVIADALGTFGRLDVFFANAGVAGRHPMATETSEAFLNMMRVNAWSVYAAIKYASVAMEKTSTEKTKSGGSIIATASVVAGVRSGAGPMSYSASKAAVINICQSAAWRLHGKNIRVNAICRGLIKTEMTKKVLEAVSSNELLVNLMKRNSALERYGEPDEIASIVAYLASREASFITGQDIKVDGGLTAALPYCPLFADE